VAAGDSEEVVLRTRLAYREGFYSNSAAFEEAADDPSRRIVVDSQYGVVKRLRISPGALVFERDERRGTYTSSATVRFRSTDNRSGLLSVISLPESIHWRVQEKSEGVKKRLSPTSQYYFEDEWSVLFQIDSHAQLGPSLPRYGEVSFVVRDDAQIPFAEKSMIYNADCVGR